MKSQMETRAEINAAKTERAYAELVASVMPGRKTPPVTIEDTEQVDRAVKACLDYMGVVPGDAPKGIDDLEERIDWLCRPSGTMHRTVRLSRGWQKRPSAR